MYFKLPCVASEVSYYLGIASSPCFVQFCFIFLYLIKYHSGGLRRCTAFFFIKKSFRKEKMKNYDTEIEVHEADKGQMKKII